MGMRTAAGPLRHWSQFRESGQSSMGSASEPRTPSSQRPAEISGESKNGFAEWPKPHGEFRSSSTIHASCWKDGFAPGRKLPRARRGGLGRSGHYGSRQPPRGRRIGRRLVQLFLGGVPGRRGRPFRRGRLERTAGVDQELPQPLPSRLEGPSALASPFPPALARLVCIQA